MKCGRLAPILKTTYTVIDRGVPSAAQAAVLPFGCAYAMPTDPCADEERWLPCWVTAELRCAQRMSVDLTGIELTMRWLVNPSSHYIMGAYLDVELVDAPLTVTVTYRQPRVDTCGAGYVIPFGGIIARDDLPGDHRVPYRGNIGPASSGAFIIGQE